MSRLENFTLTNYTLSHCKDPFANLFQEHPYLTWAVWIIFHLGLINCMGLSFVAWFERSGYAGPYRTLVNQLASLKFDQVCEVL